MYNKKPKSQSKEDRNENVSALCTFVAYLLGFLVLVFRRVPVVHTSVHLVLWQAFLLL